MPTKGIQQGLAAALVRIGEVYQQAAKENKTTSVIRSQGLIEIIHCFLREELVRRGFPKEWILRDCEVFGFPKKKSQDILVVPPHRPEVGPLLSLNVRSQLSSVAKNFDTMYERVYAEALNLHNRFPMLVLGYVYMVPLVGLDSHTGEPSEFYDFSRFLMGFSAISGRTSGEDAPWKYESVCLLVVDFSRKPPMAIQTFDDLVAALEGHKHATRIREVLPLVTEDILSLEICLRRLVSYVTKRNFEFLASEGIQLHTD